MAEGAQTLGQPESSEKTPELQYPLNLPSPGPLLSERDFPGFGYPIEWEDGTYPFFRDIQIPDGCPVMTSVRVPPMTSQDQAPSVDPPPPEAVNRYEEARSVEALEVWLGEEQHVRPYLQQARSLNVRDGVPPHVSDLDYAPLLLADDRQWPRENLFELTRRLWRASWMLATTMRTSGHYLVILRELRTLIVSLLS